MQSRMESAKDTFVPVVFSRSMPDKGMYDMDRKLRLILDGGQEKQPQLFYYLIRRDGKIPSHDLSGCFSRYLWISDSLRLYQLLSHRLHSGQRRDKNRRTQHSFILYHDAGGILPDTEIRFKELRKQ